jgi:hypothetical protein
VKPEETQPSAFWWWLGISASVVGVVAFGIVILGAAVAEWLRPAQEDVHPGLVPVRIPRSDFRSMDEPRDN